VIEIFDIGSHLIEIFNIGTDVIEIFLFYSMCQLLLSLRYRPTGKELGNLLILY
jgi:hypothetical protein